MVNLSEVETDDPAALAEKVLDSIDPFDMIEHFLDPIREYKELCQTAEVEPDALTLAVAEVVDNYLAWRELDDYAAVHRENIRRAAIIMLYFIQELDDAADAAERDDDDEPAD